LVVPYAPGGAVDSLARPVAQKLSEILGQPVIVDNRPGANATLGADNVARSSPDGYSLVLTSIVHYLVPFFSKAVPYDTMKDFTPIAQMAITPNILAVHPSMPVKSVKDLIALAKAKPGEINYISNKLIDSNWILCSTFRIYDEEHFALFNMKSILVLVQFGICYMVI
jgi:tripartite-type tricarboxylate transporter receptor subunit TctC